MPVRIQAQHVSHTYPTGSGERAVLHDVNVDLCERRVGIIGHNGSGKSTFVRMINGLITPSEGSVHVDGIDVASDAKAVRSMTGFLFTDPDSQIIMPTVAEDAAFTLRRSGLDKEEVNARVMELLDRFGLGGHADHPAHLLSGGQKQLLALAAVLIGEPKLIVADEPTTLLDLRNIRTIAAIFAQLEQTLVLATHHLAMLEGFDRVLVFNDGCLVADDTPAAAIDAYTKLMEA